MPNEELAVEAKAPEVLPARVEQASVDVIPGFAGKEAWALAQRQAQALMSSTMVPQQYRENLGNCIIAIDMAYRIGASPLLVMQNLYIVHGQPGWSSKFLIATFNKCGRFEAIRYAWNADRTECRAWSIERRTGEKIEGPAVSMTIAKDEGWSTKSGSKWKTMPELMLMYRAAAFLIRTYAPEISMGLHTVEEVDDIQPAKVVGRAWGVLVVDELKKAKAEVAAGIADPEQIIAEYMLDPEGEQAKALRSVEPNNAN